MALDYRIDFRDGNIEVHSTGTPDRNSVAQMWRDIVDACNEHQCLYVLGIANFDAPLKVADAIDHQAIFLEAGVTIDHRIAWVQLNPEAMKMTQLAETVLLNRGMVNGRIFSDRHEARRWLRGGT
ncbi:MAG: hypothetical protein QNJ14_08620 [Woeseiaceae bacterium]|nr:hypothetical protein [Woeseiaceae bacterium]